MRNKEDFVHQILSESSLCSRHGNELHLSCSFQQLHVCKDLQQFLLEICGRLKVGLWSELKP